MLSKRNIVLSKKAKQVVADNQALKFGRTEQSAVLDAAAISLIPRVVPFASSAAKAAPVNDGDALPATSSSARTSLASSAANSGSNTTPPPADSVAAFPISEKEVFGSATLDFIAFESTLAAPAPLPPAAFEEGVDLGLLPENSTSNCSTKKSSSADPILPYEEELKSLEKRFASPKALKRSLDESTSYPNPPPSPAKRRPGSEAFSTPAASRILLKPRQLPATTSKMKQLSSAFAMVGLTMSQTKVNQTKTSAVTEMWAAFQCLTGGDVEVAVVSAWENNGFQNNALKALLKAPSFIPCVVTAIELKTSATELSKSTVKLNSRSTIVVEPSQAVNASEFFFAIKRKLTAVEEMVGLYNNEVIMAIVRIAHVDSVGNEVLKGKATVYDDSSHKIDLILFAGQEAVLQAKIGSAILVVGKINVRSEEETSLIVTHFHLDLDNTAGAVNMLKLPQRQPDEDVDAMVSHSGPTKSLAMLLASPPTTGITFIPATILIHGLGGDMVSYACKVCNRTIEVADNAWFCSFCQKELDESRVHLKSRPTADISINGQEFRGCTIANGNEQAVFGKSCEQIYEGELVDDPTNMKFRCSFGVTATANRYVLNKLERCVD